MCFGKRCNKLLMELAIDDKVDMELRQLVEQPAELEALEDPELEVVEPEDLDLVEPELEHLEPELELELVELEDLDLVELELEHLELELEQVELEEARVEPVEPHHLALHRQAELVEASLEFQAELHQVEVEEEVAPEGLAHPAHLDPRDSLEFLENLVKRVNPAKMEEKVKTCKCT